MRQRPLFVICHLRWNFVYQRPQHVLSRIARSRPVYLIEEPVHHDAAPVWKRHRPHSNIDVLIPHTPHREYGFTPSQRESIAPMLREFVRSEGIRECDAWVYTPLATPLLDVLQPQVVVYDCMDELSAFLNAPRELLQMEQLLLRHANLVFTGGPSLYNAKRGQHQSVHCFPSSVDCDHFRRGVVDQQEPGAQAALPKPRLGYFGVIDERLDLELIATIADAHPEWSIVMVGPIVKIDPAAVPQRPNIHYFGQQEYAALPAFVKGWDVCLMPFAINEATRFISPTKVLEYMAAGKPIVSTPIHDVVEPYGHIVYTGTTHDEFLRSCETALVAPATEKQRRQALADQVLAATSWDRTAAAMEALMQRATRRPILPKAQPQTQIQSDVRMEFSK